MHAIRYYLYTKGDPRHRWSPLSIYLCLSLRHTFLPQNCKGLHRTSVCDHHTTRVNYFWLAIQTLLVKLSALWPWCVWWEETFVPCILFPVTPGSVRFLVVSVFLWAISVPITVCRLWACLWVAFCTNMSSYFFLYVDFGLLHMAVLYALPHTEVYVSLFVCVRMWVCVCVVCYISGDPGQNPGEWETVGWASYGGFDIKAKLLVTFEPLEKLIGAELPTFGTVLVQCRRGRLFALAGGTVARGGRPHRCHLDRWTGIGNGKLHRRRWGRFGRRLLRRCAGLENLRISKDGHHFRCQHWNVGLNFTPQVVLVYFWAVGREGGNTKREAVWEKESDIFPPNTYDIQLR